MTKYLKINLKTDNGDKERKEFQIQDWRFHLKTRHRLDWRRANIFGERVLFLAHFLFEYCANSVAVSRTHLLYYNA